LLRLEIALDPDPFIGGVEHGQSGKELLGHSVDTGAPDRDGRMPLEHITGVILLVAGDYGTPSPLAVAPLGNFGTEPLGERALAVPGTVGGPGHQHDRLCVIKQSHGANGCSVGSLSLGGGVRRFRSNSRSACLRSRISRMVVLNS